MSEKRRQELAARLGGFTLNGFTVKGEPGVARETARRRGPVAVHAQILEVGWCLMNEKTATIYDIIRNAIP